MITKFSLRSQFKLPVYSVNLGIVSIMPRVLSAALLKLDKIMAWGDVSDDFQTALHKHRIAYGKITQPDWQNDMDGLDKIINSYRQTPYHTIKTELRTKLDACCSSYSTGGKWHNGICSMPTHFYRVETLESFADKHMALFVKRSQNPNAFNFSQRTYDHATAFQKLVTAYSANKQWLKLDLMVSSYRHYRGFSWWTDDFEHRADMMPTSFFGPKLNKDNAWILDFAYGAGIASDWLSNHMIFLRYTPKKDPTGSVKVPSIIDAYNQPIFYPHRQMPIPTHGTAFTLQETIEPKRREFLLTNLPVCEIEFIPVRIDMSKLDQVNPYGRINNSMVEKMIKGLVA